jgi:hypothetical protein
MSNNMLVLFNHTLTEKQIEDAKQNLLIKEIITPPQAISQLWRSIPPEAEIIDHVLQDVRDWINANSHDGDYLLIQGEFGSVYLMVRHAMEKGLIPIYSTSLRTAEEEEMQDGSIRLVHHFNHVRFRKYGE